MWQYPRNSVFHNGTQVAEVFKDKTLGYTIRNLRPNGTVGICFSSQYQADIRPWLDKHYPGWTKEPK